MKLPIKRNAYVPVSPGSGRSLGPALGLDEADVGGEREDDQLGAIVGGVQKAIYKRLLRGEEAELPGLVPRLWEWVICIPPPPGPLRPSRRRAVRARRFEERQAASRPIERVLRAMAAEVSERATRR